MGSDIHLIFQVKKETDNTWQTIATDKQLGFEHDHVLFRLFVGMSNDWIIPISQPRGLPDDLILFDEEEYFVEVNRSICDWIEDGVPIYRIGDHIFSWLTIDEIESYQHWDTPFDNIIFEDKYKYKSISRTMREVRGGEFYIWLTNKLNWIRHRWMIEDEIGRFVFGFDDEKKYFSNEY